MSSDTDDSATRVWVERYNIKPIMSNNGKGFSRFWCRAQCTAFHYLTHMVGNPEVLEAMIGAKCGIWRGVHTLSPRLRHRSLGDRASPGDMAHVPSVPRYMLNLQRPCRGVDEQLCHKVRWARCLASHGPSLLEPRHKCSKRSTGDIHDGRRGC